MANISTLPVEILLEIASYLRPDQLPSEETSKEFTYWSEKLHLFHQQNRDIRHLARTCRRLRSTFAPEYLQHHALEGTHLRIISTPATDFAITTVDVGPDIDLASAVIIFKLPNIHTINFPAWNGWSSEHHLGLSPALGVGSSPIITFLVAGHETTFGLLSFAFLNILQNPSAYFKAQREVDEVLGKGPCQVGDLSKLKYLDAVLRETLRLTPTAPILSKKLSPGCVGERATLGKGKYTIDPDTRVMILIGAMQRDPSVYGEDANQFKPERILGENFKNIPNAAWKPFGNGVRGCIGRAFAWQEALMATALLQNFDFQLDDPGYKLRIKQNLTIKPDHLRMRATLRHGMDAKDLEQVLRGSAAPHNDLSTISKSLATTKVSDQVQDVLPMTILYGSNTGTCQTFAQRLSIAAAAYGFKSTVMDLNFAVNKLPRSQPVIIVTASYEGQPTDNAAQYVSWLRGLQPSDLAGVAYTVFGCGHGDWASTYQRIPTFIDERMVACGATILALRGSADVAKGNMPADFNDWLSTELWPAIGNGSASVEDKQLSGGLGFEISTQPSISSLRKDVQDGIVLESKVLTASNEPQKRHLEIQLPADMTYECGDYLAILPVNSRESVQRVMTRFKLPWDANIVIKGQSLGSLPMNTPLSIRDVIAGHVEIFEPATKQIIQDSAMSTTNQYLKNMLESLVSDQKSYERDVLEKRLSVLDLLEQHPEINLPFGEYLASLSPLRVRYYSISSSPLSSTSKCTVTYNVLSAPSLSGQGTFNGVAGTYLASLQPGDQIKVSVRPPSKALFHLPLNISETPLLMFCAGTGLAPFRGFVPQRAMQQAAAPNHRMAKALLFVGCRSQTKNRLYAEDFDLWQKQGVVDIRYTFSREKRDSEDCVYVHERMLMDRADISELWEQGARIYVCGSREFVAGIGVAARQIVNGRLAQRGIMISDEELEERFQKQIADRCAADIFG